MLTDVEKIALCTAVNILIEYANEYRVNFDEEVGILETLLTNNDCIEITSDYGHEWVVK